MKEAVEVIRRREFRRKELRAHAIQLAERLADYIEDKEGWHGERRQELIAELEAKQP